MLSQVAAPVVMADTFGLTAEQESEYPTKLLLELGGYGPETGGKIWDPLRLAAPEQGANEEGLVRPPGSRASRRRVR